MSTLNSQNQWMYYLTFASMMKVWPWRWRNHPGLSRVSPVWSPESLEGEPHQWEENLRDAILVALKMEDDHGPRNIGGLQKVEKDKEPDSPQSLQKGTHSNYIFTLAQWEFWPRKRHNNKFVLFQATKSIMLFYGSNRYLHTNKGQ